MLVLALCLVLFVCLSVCLSVTLVNKKRIRDLSKQTTRSYYHETGKVALESGRHHTNQKIVFFQSLPSTQYDKRVVMVADHGRFVLCLSVS